VAKTQLDIILNLVDNASKNLNSIGASMTQFGRTMTTHVTCQFVGVGLAAVKMASDLDYVYAEYQTVGKQTEAELSVLSQRFCRYVY